jgi:hypothetical protein
MWAKMSGVQGAGVVIGAVGLLFTLTIIGAFLGVPMMIAGGIMVAAGGRPTQIIQQVVVHQPTLPQPMPRPGEVREGHIYRIASDGRGYWYPMTEAEKRQHRITALEEELGL